MTAALILLALAALVFAISAWGIDDPIDEENW